MSRHHGPRLTPTRTYPVAESKKARERLLSDVAEGLELSNKMMHLAEGPWRGAGQSGRLPIQHILRDCAHRIVAEAGRCREELEAGGSVLFGAVELEDGAGPAAPELAPPLRLKDFPGGWHEPEDAPLGARPGFSPALLFKAPENPPTGALRRLWAALLALPALAGMRWVESRSRQEGG